MKLFVTMLLTMLVVMTQGVPFGWWRSHPPRGPPHSLPVMQKPGPPMPPPGPRAPFAPHSPIRHLSSQPGHPHPPMPHPPPHPVGAHHTHGHGHIG